MPRRKSQNQLQEQARRIAREARRSGNLRRERIARDAYQRYRGNIERSYERLDARSQARWYQQMSNDAYVNGNPSEARFYGDRAGNILRNEMNRPIARSTYMGLNNG